MVEVAVPPPLQVDSQVLLNSEHYNVGQSNHPNSQYLKKLKEVAQSEDEGFHSDKNQTDGSSGDDGNPPKVKGLENQHVSSQPPAKRKLEVVSMPNMEATPRLSPSREQENGMDLKQQLVIWKKANYLLDNISITPALCGKLIEEGIFTTDMINQVHSKVYNVEKNLMLLTQLGTYGEDVYEGFLRSLWESDHIPVVKELRRTFTHTKFGEMLPPTFTYFLDLDEFLRKYPHIGLKLGEEGKYLLHCFIEGKIEIERRKRGEYIDKLKAERDRLLRIIENLTKELNEYKRRLREAEERIKLLEEKIESLQNRIKELEENNREQRTEIRRLKHFHKQQKDLDAFLKQEAEDLLPKAPKVYVRESSKDKEETKPELPMQEQMSFQLLQSQVNIQVVKMDLARSNMIHLNKEEKRLQELKTTLQQKLTELEKQKSNLDRQKTSLSRTKSNLSRTRSNLRSGMVRKRSTMQPRSRKVSTESRVEENEENKIGKEIREFTLEVKRSKKVLEQQIKENEKDLVRRERELDLKEKELNAARDYKINTYSDLTTKVKNVIENLKRLHSTKQTEMIRKHDREIDEFIQRLKDMNLRHLEECAHLRGRIRQKMQEIYRRETLHKKLRKQIQTLCNYQAKSMNSTVSVEQCRKIVRGIIGDARKLRAIVEERELRDDEKVEGAEDDEKEDKKEKKKKGKKRKKYQALADERLQYVAERIYLDWRILGKKLDMTDNRMDMIEIDVPPGQFDRCTLNMLKVWRDEEKGKSEILYNALIEMNRSELAVVVIPKKRLANAAVVDIEELKRNPEGVVLPQIVEPGQEGEENKEQKPKKSTKGTKGKGGKGKKGGASSTTKLPQLVPPAK